MDKKNFERTARDLHAELTGLNLDGDPDENDLRIAKAKYQVDIVDHEIVRVNQEKEFPRARNLLIHKLFKRSQVEKSFSKPGNVYSSEYIAFQLNLDDDPKLIKQFFDAQNFPFFKAISSKEGGTPEEYEYSAEEFDKWIKSTNMDTAELQSTED